VAELQLVEGAFWRREAEAKRTRVVVREAPRGRILDRRGVPLAEDAVVHQLAAVGWTWERRARVRCTSCGVVHFHRVGGTPPRRCGCGEPASRLEPLPLPDVLPLERLLGIEPGGIARRVEARLEEVERLVAARRARYETADEPSFLVGDAVRLYREDLLNRPYPIVKRIPDAALRLLELDEDGTYRGLVVTQALRRLHPQGDLVPQLLGYASVVVDAEELEDATARYGPMTYDTRLGRGGLEASYDAVLLGRLGEERQGRDEEGAFTVVLEERPPRRGRDLRLCLTVEACRAAERALRTHGDAAGYFPGGQPSGGFVALDAATGEVLAWAEMPTYDLEGDLATLYDPREREATRDAMGEWHPAGPLREGETLAAFRERLSKPAPRHLSRVMQVAVEPGSTLKPFVGLGLLSTGLSFPFPVFSCGDHEGYLPGCHRHPPVDFEGAIETSCNRYFAMTLRDVATHWPKYRHGVAVMLRDLGFGRPTGADVAAESPGTWLRDWSDFDARAAVERAVDAAQKGAPPGVEVSLLTTPATPGLVAGRGAERLEQTVLAVLGPVLRAVAPGAVLVRTGRGEPFERYVGLTVRVEARREGGEAPEVPLDVEEMRRQLAEAGATLELGGLPGGGASFAFELRYHQPIGRAAGDPPVVLPDDGRNVAIGQGPVSATPLQMARAMAAIATGGRLVTPHVAGWADETPLRFQTETVRLDPGWLSRVRTGLRAVTSPGGIGTARDAGFEDLPAQVHGKTGTAQTGLWWRPGVKPEDGPWHHWFVGYAEGGARTIAFACVLHSRTEEAAGKTAVHAVRDFLAWWYDEGEALGGRP
jgi:cell division protein FtsI/penicillin-binding protein 2